MKQTIENQDSDKSLNRSNKEDLTMSVIEKATQVNVPLHTAYNP